MHIFRSDAAAPRERFEFWGDFLNRTLAPFRIEPGTAHAFDVEMAMQKIGELPLARVAGAGYRGTRGPLEIARTPVHFYIASIHLGGTTSLISRGEERQLECGDVFLLDTLHEVTFGLDRPYRHLMLTVPKEWLDARLPRADRLCGSVLPHHSPLARLFAGYLGAGYETADQLSPSAAALFSQHLLDLLCEAFAGVQPDQPAPSKAWRAALFVRACRLIALDYGRPDLRPDLIADQLGISTRMLHRIFAEHGESVMQHVLRERIGRAAKLLACTQARDRTITEIAFACGFNDLTHFGRVFDEQMNMTPSEWRRREAVR